jgi:thiol-disulfide isomerase/thioredoxin
MYRSSIFFCVYIFIGLSLCKTVESSSQASTSSFTGVKPKDLANFVTKAGKPVLAVFMLKSCPYCIEFSNQMPLIKQLLEVAIYNPERIPWRDIFCFAILR